MIFTPFNQRAINLAVVGMVLAVLSALALFLYQSGLAEAQDSQANNEATGNPTISGMAQASETLTVDTSAISDADGLVKVNFDYQWISNDGTTDTEITGETSSTYIVKPWDLGKHIKVRVSFTDDAGNEETLTSAATAAVEANPNHPAIGWLKLLGMAEVGQALRVVGLGSGYRWGIHDANGLTNATFNYQWIRNDGTTAVDIPNATGESYTLTDDDEGKTIKVRMSFIDDAGNEETLTSTETTAVTARPSSSELSAPTSLSVSWSQGEEKGIELNWTAPEGTITGYQILRLETPTRSRWWEPYPYGCTPFMEVHVSDTGSDTTTYTDTDVAEGASYTYSVRAINSDGVGRKAYRSFNLQYRHGTWPAGVPGTPSRAPTNLVSSQIKNGVGLTWNAPEGEVTGYQILRRSPEQCDYGYRVYVENTNSTDTHWADRDVVAGTRYQYHVRAMNDVGAGRLDTRDSTSLRPTALVVGPEPNNPATGTPTITGTAQVGETLTADPSGIADADGMYWSSFSYQWLSNRDMEIEGATGATYTLQSSDANKVIKVKVTFTDDGVNEESLTSAATTAVAAAVPGIPGSLAVSVNDTGKLDLSWEAPDSNGGSAVTGYRVQWKEAVGSWDTPEDVSEATVTGTSHTATGLTDGVEYTFRVFAVNTVGDSTASEGESGTPKETSVPIVSSATVDGATLILTFSESLTETPLPAVTTFTVTVGGNQRGVDSLAISGSTLTLTLASAMTSSEQVSISYTVPSDAAAARLKDLSDNSVASFAAQAVTNNTAAAQTLLTASIHSEPASHDGQAGFTFELRFSENLEGFSYRTLRDHAFTVTGGEVKGARRLVRGSNTRWEIKVRPTANADVVIVLPITTVCTADGAVCTEAGSKLSNRLELTVSGPTSQHSSQPQENTPATGSPTISGTVQVGETLTASTPGISDTDGLTNPSYSYQWLSSRDAEIDDATGSTYVLVDSDAGKTIKVQVTFTDDAGNEETLTSTATASVEARPNSPATGAPTISGTVQVRETLTASTSGIADTDGLTSVSYSYQWTRSDGSTDTDIQGAAGSSYSLVDADEGKTIKVQVSFTDDADNEETLFSAATTAVAARPNAPATGSPTISGMAQLGETLTGSTSGIADTDGLTNVTYSYQWIRNDGSSDSDIAGATGPSYTLVDADEGKTIKVQVSFTDDADNEETLFSAATTAVAARPNAPATGSPTISGMAQLGETLTGSTSGIADTDGLTNVTYSYQWIRNDGSSDSDIAGATGPSYTLVDADEGKTLKVKVSFADDAGNDEQLSSAATAAVAAAPPPPNTPATGLPTITGTAQVGETLAADTTGIADDDGLDSAAFSYQWLADDAEINGATAPTYILVADDEGKAIKVQVSFTDDAGNEETLPSAATAAVAARPNSPATGAPTISGTVQVRETLTASTSGIADTDGLTNVSYSYQWIRNDGSADTVIQGAAGSSYSLVDADEGKTIKVQVSFTDDAGNDEELTSAATASVAGAPEPITVILENNPASHNGTDEFTFQIRFSEHFKLSYKTLRDHAFTAVGGTVKKAQRQVKGSNIGWTITVEPASNAEVEIVLPATTDCGVTGAICTADGRKLSNSLDFTVVGPGE